MILVHFVFFLLSAKYIMIRSKAITFVRNCYFLFSSALTRRVGFVSTSTLITFILSLRSSPTSLLQMSTYAFNLWKLGL